MFYKIKSLFENLIFFKIFIYSVLFLIILHVCIIIY